MLVPYLEEVFGGLSSMIISSGNMIIMCIMVATIIVLAGLLFGKTRKKIVPIYLSGVNEGDNRTFAGAMQKDVQFSLRNWHMEN